MAAAYYNPADPISNERTLDDKTFTVDHFFTKLFKLPALMNTEAAKTEANERVQFMRAFLDQLASEIPASEKSTRMT